MGNANILIVDDVVANLKVLMATLKQEGYKVRPITNPKMVFDIARKTNADLILLDVRMPQMDGFEVCQRLKDDPELRDIPVIFISAQSTSEAEADQFFASGAVDFVLKPFDVNEVLTKVRQHLR